MPKIRAETALERCSALTARSLEDRMAILLMPDLDKTVHIPSFSDLALCGIYFLLHEEVVVYVGQAKCIRSRVASHIAEGSKVFDAVAFVGCKPEDLNELERGYIKKLLPKYNQCHYARSLRYVGEESANGGRLVGVSRKMRIPRANIRRTLYVLA